MSDKKLTQEQVETTEDFVVSVLTNEPSEPMQVPNQKVIVVFKRPSMMSKFKQRAWSGKKLKEIGIVKEDEDPQTEFFFRYWGTLNSFVDRILVEDSAGKIKLNGKTYSEYLYDAANELDYKSLFEKFVMEEIYAKGLSEEAFVSSVIILHANWINENTKVKDDDIKNS